MAADVDSIRAQLALAKVRLLIEKAIERYPAGTPGGLGGRFKPGQGRGSAGTGRTRSAGQATPPRQAAAANAQRGDDSPPRADLSRFRQDHPGVVRARNRIAALDAMARAGDIDGVRNFPTTRSHTYTRLIDDHRTALLQHMEPAARMARIRGAAPAAPDIRGNNMNNSALVSARRHVERLTHIAQNHENPLQALREYRAGVVAPPGGRTNVYLREAQSYHQALIAHYSQGEAASRGTAARREAAAAPAPAPAPAPAAAPRQPRARRAATPAAPQAAESLLNNVRAAHTAGTTRGGLMSRQDIEAVNAHVSSSLGLTGLRASAAHSGVMDALRDRPVNTTPYRQELRADYERGHQLTRALVAQAAARPAAAAPAAPPPVQPNRGATDTFNRSIGVNNGVHVIDGRTVTIGSIAMDTRHASNPQGLSVNELGFVPRPNVPMDNTVRRDGIQTRNGVQPYASEEKRLLANAYLTQSTDLQVRARDYQTGRYTPKTAEQRAAAAERQRQAEVEHQQRMRGVIEREASIRASNPAEWQPQSRVGGNVSRMNADVRNSTLPTSVFQTKENASQFAKRLIADYGNDVKFTGSISASGDRAEVQYTGSDGTRIQRRFSKNPDGTLDVYHAYFAAGSRGQGSGKRFFRVAFGEYKAIGVSTVGVSANIDVGGYAWARFGFLPKTDSDWRSLARTVQSKADSLLARGDITPEVHRQIGALTSGSDRRNLWKVADMQHEGVSVGKKLLMNTHWSGQIKLTDREQMQRFTAYTSEENARRGRRT